MKEYKGCKVPTNLDKYTDRLEMDYPDTTACSNLADNEMQCIGIPCSECILHIDNHEHLTTYLREQNMNKEQTEALERIESIRAELEQLERVVAKPAWEPEPGDAVEVRDGDAWLVRTFVVMRCDRYECYGTNSDRTDSIGSWQLWSECRPATPVVAPKHVEPELVLCLTDQGEWADRYGWKGKHEGMRKHGRIEIGLAEYDVILTDKSACDSNCIWLGYWNDGPV